MGMPERKKMTQQRCFRNNYKTQQFGFEDSETYTGKQSSKNIYSNLSTKISVSLADERALISRWII